MFRWYSVEEKRKSVVILFGRKNNRIFCLLILSICLRNSGKSFEMIGHHKELHFFQRCVTFFLLVVQSKRFVSWSERHWKRDTERKSLRKALQILLILNKKKNSCSVDGFKTFLGHLNHLSSLSADSSGLTTTQEDIKIKMERKRDRGEKKKKKRTTTKV